MELNYLTLGFPKVRIVKTERYWNYTDKEKLLDPLCGNTSFIFGYNNRTIINSMIDLQSRIGFLRGKSDESCEENDRLISEICKRGNFDSLTWAVSGSDGVEAAVYINDQYWKSLGKTKPTIVVFSPGYHGTTYLAKIFRKEYHDECRAVVIPRSFDDNDTVDVLKELLKVNKQIGAVLIESAPWNGGLRLWTNNFWYSVRELCTQYKINFIVDDVLGGVGKLGNFFSHQRYAVQPDIVVLGKSLTGGYSPLSCACTTKTIAEIVKGQWNFGHTWSPNMGGVGAALAVIDIFDHYNFNIIEKCLTDLGSKLQSLNLIESFSATGLMLYLSLSKKYDPLVLINSGINGTINDQNGIFICAPAVADREYFIELENRLINGL